MRQLSLRSTLLLIFSSIYLMMQGQLKITLSLCENLKNPIGLDEVQPNFSWQISSDLRGTMQTAYEIKIATSEDNLLNNKNILWQTKQENTDQSTYIAYKGKPLTSDTRYYWQVRVWDNKGRTSPWSDIAYFHTGLFHANDWRAKWINSNITADTVDGISPLLRKSFQVSKKIAQATAFITAKGLYTAYLNGQKIGNDLLTPGWTSYKNRIQYQVYDVTKMIQDKENVIGAQLGSGWFRTYLAWQNNKNIYGNDIALLLQININYTDGTSQTIVSDESWKSSEGGIRFSEIYDGEIYDATKYKMNWNGIGYNDSDWNMVKVLPIGNAKIIATYNEPIRKRETFQPKQIIKTPKGETVIDFGQNLVGWVRIKGRGSAGKKLQWKHFEVLDKKGNVYMDNMRDAKVNTTYTFAGSSVEEYAPMFTFYGFRYIWIELGTELVSDLSFEAEAIYSDMALTGKFECSDTMVNQLQHNIQWGQRGNFLDVPTDCPQRDERLGWTGDAQAFSRTAGYNFGVNNFFKKWLKDLAYDQNENGSVPWVIPNVLGPHNAGSTGWADVATIIPWDIYTVYGDKRVLVDQYPSMKKWVEYMRSKSTNNLWNTGEHFGDWLFYSQNDDNGGASAVTYKYLITQCFYAHSTQLLINAAKVLGKNEDIAFYADLLAKIKKAFQEEYVTSTGRLVSNTQTAYVLALNFDMMPENLKSKASQYLVENINKYGHLTTGFLGTPYLNHVLTNTGHDTLAHKLLFRKQYPSWLYPITKGATTIWERWNGIEVDGEFQAKTMNSFNHYAYGAIGDWMYQNIAGIKLDRDKVAYKSFVINPHMNDKLSFAKGEYSSTFGKITSAWKKSNSGIAMEVEVPVNTEATIHIPIHNGNVLVNGIVINQNSDCKIIKEDTITKIVKVGSGKYLIETR